MNRKVFFKVSFYLFFIIASSVWLGMTKLMKRYSSPEIKKIDIGEIKQGINFFEEVIIHRDEKGFTVLSSRCTHLGCLIKETKGDTLLCPCHGSRFGFDGRKIKGPASGPLKKLDFQISEESLLVKL